MINIEKSTLEFFEQFKKQKNATSYQDDCNDVELKKRVRDDLLAKQRGQCAYCERKIDEQNKNFHIEHIEPRDKNHKLECEYSNLVLSCNEKDSCGEYKGSKKWENDFIHPVLNNPENSFKFSFNGEIGAYSESGSLTIDFLNLNSRKLVSRRKNVLLSLNAIDDGSNIEGVLEHFNEFENLLKNINTTHLRQKIDE